MRIQVRDFMSSPVATAVSQNTVSELRALMDRKNIHAIPIIAYTKQLPVAEVTIQGIITSTDLNKDIDAQLPIEQIMTDRVHIIHPDSSARSAAKMMLKHQVHHLVVMEDGKITGMVSSMDFVGLVAEHSLD